jgi:hypothetical protein
MAMEWNEGPVDAWEFDRDVPGVVAVRCALDRVEPPTMRVLVTSSTGDTITVDLLEGALSDPDSLVYVERRGLFEVARVEALRRPRLVLRAFPSF